MAKDKKERPINKNELAMPLVAMHALNPAVAYNAPARGTMFAGHFAQRPVIEGSEPSLFQTGAEEEFGKYTFSVKMPEDGTILAVIERYKSGVTNAGIEFNPETYVFYQADKTGEIDYFVIPYYASFHPTFGFKYEMKPASKFLRAGNSFEKDTVFADSPAVKGESHYTYGKNLNVIYMSHPNVGLDGYVINRDALKHFAFRVYETRSIEVGANNIPLNHLGDDEFYKIMPDIGEMVPEDGLLMVTRKHDAYLAPALLSKNDLREVDYVFDRKTYARPGKGRVVGLNVIKSDNITRQLPPEMTVQLEKYASAGERFHQDVIRFNEGLQREAKKNGGEVSMSKKLAHLIILAKGKTNYTASKAKLPLTLTYKREPIDTWRIDFTIEYIMLPTRGSKITCMSGGKGVICRIAEPWEMPVDADGNVADVISSPDSIPGRMNLGRLYSPYFNGASRDITREILEIMGFPRKPERPITKEELECVPESAWNEGVGRLLKFYSIVSERSYKEFTELLTPEERVEWMLMIFNEAPTLYVPIETEESFDNMVLEIEKNFKLVYGPVTYIGRSGKKITTLNKFRIAPLLFMLLDKIADTWLSVDFGKHNNFGTLAAMNQMDKHATPWRKTPPRTVGETEGRLDSMYGGRELSAETMDRGGNIATQKAMATGIINAENPTDIENLVDRNIYELGNARPNQMMNHITSCVGFDIVYEPEAE